MFVSHLHFSVNNLRRTIFIGSRRKCCRHGSWMATDATDFGDEANIIKKTHKTACNRRAFGGESLIEGTRHHVLLSWVVVTN